MSDAGIYTITNTATGRVYVGGSLHVGKRMYEHRLDLERHRHANRMLQADFLKFGQRRFKFEVVLADVADTDVAAVEVETIHAYAKRDVPLYNVKDLPGIPERPKYNHAFQVPIDEETYHAVRALVEEKNGWKHNRRRGMGEWLREAVREKAARDLAARAIDA